MNNEKLADVTGNLCEILFDNLLEGVALCRTIPDDKGNLADWEYLRVNKAFEPLTGLKNIIGRKITEIIPGIKDSNPELFAVYGRVSATCKPEEFETEIKELSLYLHISVFSPVKGYFVAVFENISERKKNESKIQESEAKYRNIFENSPIGIYQSTPGGKFISVNPAFVKMAGFSSADEMKNEIKDIGKQLYVDAGIREKFKKEIAQSSELRSLETLIRRKNGELFWASINCRALRGANGEISYYDGTVIDINDRKLAEEALKESEERYRQLVEASPGAIAVFWDDKFLYANSTALKLLKIGSFEELKTHRVSEIVAPEDREILKARIEQMLKVGKVPLHEYHLKLFDGQSIRAEATSALINFEGSPAIQTVLDDITARKKIEEALKNSEEKLRDVIRFAPTFMYRIDFNIPKFTDVNDSMCELLGYTREALLDMNPYDILDEESKELLKSRVEQWKAGKIPSESVEYKVRTLDGRFRNIELSVRFSLMDGKMGEATVIGHDVTERKKLEDELSLFNERLMIALSALKAGAWDWDLRTNSQDWTPEMYEILGIPRSKKANFELSKSSIHKEDLAEVEKQTEQGLNEHKDVDIEFRIVRPDGQVRWINGMGKGIYDFHGKPVRMTGILRDITDRKKYEEMLKKDKGSFEKLVNERTKELLGAQLALEKAKRLSDIGMLASTVAHEMRNPLAAINMAAYNIRKKAKSAEFETHLRTVENKVKESNTIINNLLFYSRIKPPHYENVKINEVLDECLDDVRSQYPKKKVNVERKYNDLTGTSLRADIIQMKELFHNILNNAFDSLKDEKGNISIEGKTDGILLEIVCKDNGCGIDKKNMSKIYDAFFSTKAKGTGLGLTVCGQIVKLHNGEINIESEKDLGTSVIVRIPLKEKNE